MVGGHESTTSVSVVGSGIVAYHDIASAVLHGSVRGGASIGIVSV